MNGMSHWFFPMQFWRNVTGSVPLNVVFGEPVDLSEQLGARRRAATYAAVTETVMARLRECAEEERIIRSGGQLELDKGRQ